MVLSFLVNLFFVITVQPVAAMVQSPHNQPQHGQSNTSWELSPLLPWLIPLFSDDHCFSFDKFSCILYY